MEKEKCFVIMPISDQEDYPQGHFTKVYEQIIKPAIYEAGYEPYRVDENAISDSIIVKIFEAIQECPMAICDLSGQNPNVLYELGIRQAYDKPVVLIQDDKTRRIFDVSGINTVQYKRQRLYEDVIEAREKITKSIIETKEGKRNSIIKIVKTHMAEISKENITKEDRLEVMLAGIIDDIKDIKNTKSEPRLFSREIVLPPGHEFYMDTRTDSANNERHYILFLKKDVKNSKIEEEIQKMQKKYSINLIYKRNKDILEIECIDDVTNIMDWKIKELCHLLNNY